MNVLRTVWAEFLGMFIDDGALALAAIVWIAILAVAVKGLGLPGLTGALLLFVGLLGLLGESLYRAARKKRRG